MDYFFFVGPYVEYLVPEWPECPPRFEDAWDQLRNDRKRLVWNTDGEHFSYVTVGKKRVIRVCGAPVAKGRGAPRRMYWKAEHTCLGCYALSDLHKVDPATDVDWFTAAYAVELEQLTGIFGTPPPVRWGLVAWSD